MPDDHRRPVRQPAGLEVRPARPADLATLARIEADSFVTDKLSRRSFLRLTRSPSATVLVACRGERPVGYAIVLTRTGSQSARLYSIAVGAGEAGRGVGSLLMKAAEDAALARGANRLRLEVRVDNTDAIAFYKARGYRQLGERANYYADGMTALLLARSLTNSTNAPARRLRRAA